MQSTLYVGDLSPEATEATLYTMFSAVGPVASIRICRDGMGGGSSSLGYAYVNFHRAVDAERALDTLNYSKILDRPCRIMWSQRDPSLRKSGEGNIFVSNLSKAIDNRKLMDTFSMFGDILSCKVACDPETGQSWGYGFVHYTNEESAQKAIEKVNGMELDGKVVYVTKWKSQKEREEQSIEHYVSVYVKNFPEDWDDERLQALAKEFGEIKSCSIARGDDGKSKGFGFINFKKTADAKKAVVGLNDRPVDGHDTPLYAARAQTKKEREKHLREKFAALREQEANRNLYVKGLLDSVDNDQLRAVFSSVGTIQSCRVMRERSGVSKGFGFVLYETEEAAQKAIAQFHSKELHGIGGPLHVSIAKKKPLNQNRNRNKRYGPQMQNNGGMFNNQRNNVGPWLRYNNSQPYGNFGPPPQNYGHYPPAGGPPYPPQYPGAMGVPYLQTRQPYSQMPYQMPPQPAQPTDDLTKRLASVSNAKEQKQMIGEQIFQHIEKKGVLNGKAGKITGMLLEMDSAALLNLLRTPELLDLKIDQAADVLRKFEQGSGQKAVE